MIQNLQPPPLLFPQIPVQQPLFPQIPQPPRLLNTSFQMLEMTINRTVESENSDRYYKSEHYEPEENQFDDSPSDPEPIPDTPESPSYEPSPTCPTKIFQTPQLTITKNRRQTMIKPSPRLQLLPLHRLRRQLPPPGLRSKAWACRSPRGSAKPAEDESTLVPPATGRNKQ